MLTNKKRFLGASTVLFDDILKDFANAYGNFSVIFSSVHEVLLLPTPDSSDLDFIPAINRSVNDTQVQAEVTESINGNNWNSWDTINQAEYFYQHIYGINIDELDILETEFGCIVFPTYDSGLKVPLGIMKPSELKLYLYLLRNGESRHYLWLTYQCK